MEMKVIGFFVLFSFFGLPIFGQLIKGTWLVGGSTTSSFGNVQYPQPNGVERDKISSILISSNIGYFLFDKWVFGLTPSYSHYHTVNNDSSHNGSSYYVIGPFFRHYFLSDTRYYNVFTYASLTYGFLKSNGTGFSSTRVPTISNAVSIGGGLAVFFNSAVSIELLAGYYRNNNTFQRARTSLFNEFQSLISFQFYLKK